MIKIYISSTYSDLKEYREKVYHKLRELQHDVIAMEDYVAADQRPLDRCLEDVARSDLYVGIFAWRYGYIPPDNNPEHKSITELEYRKAIDSGKSTLIFLLDKQAAWPAIAMDQTTGEGDQGKRIMELRRELEQKLLLSPFHSPDDLAGLVATAVIRWEKEHPLQDGLTAINQLLVQVAAMSKVISGDVAQFAEEDVYPEQCTFVIENLRTASKPIQELLDAVNHLPITTAMFAGSLRQQSNKTLYRVESLVSELIELVVAFRPICQQGSMQTTKRKQTTTKREGIQLKLQELAQSLDNSIKTLEQLTDSIQGHKTIVLPGVQQFSAMPLLSSTVSASSTPSGTTLHATDSTKSGLTQLREMMYDKYDVDGFKLLCKDMGTNYESLRIGVLNLIEYCDRHKEFDKLIQLMLKELPDLQGQL